MISANATDWFAIALAGQYQQLAAGIDGGACNPKLINNSGATIWHCLAKSGNYAGLLQAIKENRFDPASTLIPNSGATVWHWLAYGGHYQNLELAIDKDQLFNPSTTLAYNSGGSIWHWLALGGHYVALTQAIADGRCDPKTALTNRNATVWHWLALGGHYKYLAQAIDQFDLDPETMLADGATTIWKHLAQSAKSVPLAQAILDKRMSLQTIKSSMHGVKKYISLMDMLDHDLYKAQTVVSSDHEHSELVYAILLLQIRDNQTFPKESMHYKKLLNKFIMQKFADQITCVDKFAEVFKEKIHPELLNMLFQADFAYDFRAIDNLLKFLADNVNKDTIEDLNDLLMLYREVLISYKIDRAIETISPLLAKIYANRHLFANEAQRQRFYTFWDSGLWTAVIPQSLHTSNKPITTTFSRKRAVSLEDSTVHSPATPKRNRCNSI